MRRVHGIVGAGLVALVASAGFAGQAQRASAPAPSVAHTGSVDTLGRAVLPGTQALFDGYVRDDKMPGIVGAFGVGDRPTWFVSAGRIATDANAPAATPDTLWRVYSMTKPVTAMAAMILIEEGKIGLDDPLSKYIPAFKQMRVFTNPDVTLDSVPANSEITIRELLTHTSGLGYNINAKGPLLKLLEAKGILPAAVNTRIEAAARRTRPATLADFADRVASIPLVYQPGTRWHYSIGLDVMGRVIEVASGMPFDRFVQQRLFDPLKMTSSFWTVPARDASRLATNYAIVGDQLSPLDPGATSVWLKPPSFPYGGAGLVMSARDYDRFLHMLADEGTLDGVRVMKPRDGAARHVEPAAGGRHLRRGGWRHRRRNAGGDANGLRRGRFGVSRRWAGGMPSKGTYGWGGAAGTVAFVDPVKKVRGTIMVNYFPADRWPVRQETVRALAADLSRFKR
ncbi:beta-lactamase family protein [Sphingomonas sp. WKB10]|nr:beta-lactamase family protein [Sphingomonas sp. WKB10]